MPALAVSQSHPARRIIVVDDGPGGETDPPLAEAGFEITSRPYQAGLAQAVGWLIGHAPGKCEVCRMPAPTPERRILLAALAAQERGPRGLPLALLELAARVRAAA